MRISVNHIRSFNQQYQWSGDPAPHGTEALVRQIGTHIGAVEEVQNIGERYEGVIIVRVVTCADHPNAERLHVCTVDDGGVAPNVERNSDGHVQVVCGAPNVHAGMLAAWLPPGSTVPETFDAEPFVLQAKPLRGVVSNGMLASARELALTDDHSGIVEIDTEVAPGTPFAQAYGLQDDVIIDIENKMFTHRPDCFGMMGVAREIAGVQGQAFISPDWYTAQAVIPVSKNQSSLPLTIQNQLPDLVPRFSAVVMADVVVKPSPLWLQVRLAALGIRPINNIVDLTNYAMVVTGQPLHAYDYDKIRELSGGQAELTIRYPQENETIALLNGKTITPRPQAMMVAAGSHLVCVGGAMGSAIAEVNTDTRTIILEAATWDMYSLRRTAMAHGIFTDAVTRFTKGQSPLQTMPVLAWTVPQITQYSGGEVATPAIDDLHIPKTTIQRSSLYSPVRVSAEFINQRLGSTLTKETIANLLRNVEFTLMLEDEDLIVTAPFWRTDIAEPEDVVEEVGRLYGYDKLTLTLPRRDVSPAPYNPELAFNDRLRHILARAGANEVQTYTFVHGDLLTKAGQDPTQAFAIRNALSPDLQYYRLGALPSLLDKVHGNIKQGYREFALFEVSKRHQKGFADEYEPHLPHELPTLSLIFAADERAAAQYAGAPYYQAKQLLEYIARQLGVELDYEPIPAQAAAEQAFIMFEPKRTAFVTSSDSQYIGAVGELKRSVQKNFKLPTYSAGFVLNLEALFAAASARTASVYRPLSPFPLMEQDLCLRVPVNVTYAQLEDILHGSLTNDPALHVTVSPVDIYQRAQDAEHKQITYHIVLQHSSQTLTTTDVNQRLQQAVQAASGLRAQQI